MFKNIVNLTPHAIVVRLESGEDVTIPPSGQVARAFAEMTKTGEVNGIPVRTARFGAPVGLPEPEPGTAFIVSTLVLQALEANHIKRDDLVAPDTSPDSVIRDEAGRIVAVRGFQVI